MSDLDHGVEHRRSVRTRRRHPVRLDPGGVQALTDDISPGGAFILTARGWPTGSRVRLTFFSGRWQLRAEGLVRWERRAPEYPGALDPIGVGIEFVTPLEQWRRLT